MKFSRIALTAALIGCGLFTARAASAEDIKLRIASGHPPVQTYVNLMTTYFVPEVTKRVAARTKHKVEFIEAYGGSIVKVADVLEGVQSGIVDIGGFCFCFEPSNLPLHAFQVMLPFGTMDPVVSVKLARAVYDKVPYMSKVLEDKFNQRLLGLIADNGYNLGTSFDWNTVADLKGKKTRRRRPEPQVARVCGGGSGAILAAGGVYLDADRGLQRLDHVPVGLGAVQALRNRQVLYRNRLWSDYLARAYDQQGALRQAAEDVQNILLEVGREYEARTGTVNLENYPKQLDQLRANGVTVKKITDAVRRDWANTLKDWPQQKANELDKQGLPASQVLKLALEEAEKLGHKWPLRYQIK